MTKRAASTLRTALLAAGVAVVVGACAGDGSTSTTASAGDTSAPPTTSTPTTSSPTSTTTFPPEDDRTPVVIDTDMAAEGIMSILYLLGREELNVLAITVSGTGLVHCDAGVDQVLGLIALTGADPIPVACGPETPLEGRNTFPTSWRVGADEAYGLDLPAGPEPSSLGAPELLATTISGSPKPVLVYADGPQTNLAQALRLDPSIVDNVDGAYLMGGAVDVPGNAIRNPDAEWNMWVDPLAAHEVLTSGLPVTLVTLDATNQVPLNVFHLKALEEHQATPGAEAVVTMLSGNDQVLTGGLYFWDQLTAALLADPTLATTSTRSIEVVLSDDRSIAGITSEGPSGSPVEVVGTVEVERFETEFLSGIAGEGVGPIVKDADWTATFDGADWRLELPEELQAGSYTVEVTNDGETDVGLVVGYLTGDATVQDIVDWPSQEQPPFYEISGFVYALAGSTSISAVVIDQTATYVFVGFEDTADVLPDILAAFDVTG